MNAIVLPYFAAAVRFAGAVDYLEPSTGVRGWVVDPAAPGVPLVVEARCGGQVLCRSVAVVDRPDIDSVLGRTTQCGFLLGWSRFDRDALERLAKQDASRPLEFFIGGGEDSQIPVVRDPITLGECLGHLRGAPKGDHVAAFRHLNEYLEIQDSGLFDTDWYVRTQPGIETGVPPLLDYLRRGEAAGATPSLYFDPKGYALAAELTGTGGALLHYLRRNAVVGLAPSIHFDNRWYRSSFKPVGVDLVAHYLQGRRERGPNRWFDPVFYLAKAGAGAAVTDPYEHFLRFGLAAGIPPSAGFEKSPAPREGLAFLKLVERVRLPGAVPAGWAPAKPAPAMPAEKPAPAPVAAPAKPPLAKPPPPAPAKPAAAEAPKPVAAPPAKPAPAAKPAAAAPAKPAAAKPAVGRAPARPTPQPSPPGLAGEFRPLDGGFGETEKFLAALPKPERTKLLRRAEQETEAGGPHKGEALLLLAAGRFAEGDRAASAGFQAQFLDTPETQTAMALGEIESRFAFHSHQLYEAGNRRPAADVYRALHRRGFRDLLISLRLLETALDANDIVQAEPYAAELEREHSDRLNVWGFLALSRYHHLRGQVASSVLILRGLPPYPQTDAIAEAVVAHRLIEAGEFDLAGTRLAAAAESPAAEVFAARFRLAVKRGAVAEILAADEERCGRDVPDWVMGEAMFILAAVGNMPSPEEAAAQRAVYRLLQGRSLESRPVAQARIHFLLYQKRWDELGALFRELEGGPLARDRETLLRKLEYYCHADNAEGAERIYQETFAGTQLGKWESLTILRLLSELKRWEEAGKVLRGHVASGYGFAGAGHTAMRIVRKAGVHQALLDAAAEEGHVREADLDDFLHLVNEDMVIVQSARAMTPNTQVGNAPARYRSNWLITGGDPFADAHADYCLFLCTNQRYFLSLLTFLCSFLGQSPQVGGRIFVFLDRDVPRHWHGSIAMIAARFNRSIDIVQEEEFVPPAVDHRVEYGFFAGGAGLSRAAYFRLYAARYLLERYQFRRAVYTDTDIVCRADMTGMFELDLGDKLMSARIEDYSPEVINAAGRNDIDPRAYFNSGVLLLRFDDERLPAFINEAIRVSEEEPDRLVFHDQCALNIAFKDNFSPLPDRYNFFLRPSRERNGFIEDGVLLHYLDKPKPWDIVFDRTYREEWRVWALVLGSILPQGLYVDIFAAGNRD